MGFLSFLKKLGVIAGQTAPEIIGLIDPPLGALLSTLVNSVLFAEAKVGSGRGELKKAESLSALHVAAPLILRVMETATGKQLADPELLHAGLEKLNDGMVDILNAFRILPKRENLAPAAR